MHVHEIYKLNNNSRKKHFFQINIPITPAMLPEKLVLCPQAGLPEDTPNHASLSAWKAFCSFNVYLLTVQPVPGTVLCSVSLPLRKAIDSFSGGHSP